MPFEIDQLNYCPQKSRALPLTPPSSSKELYLPEKILPGLFGVMEFHFLLLVLQVISLQRKTND